MPIPFLSSINLTKNEVENFKIYNLANDPGTLTSGGDFGYFWLNTTNSGGTIPTLKWWDGTNVRSLIDSTNISAFTAGLATDLAGGGAGQIVYQDGVNDTKFLAAGTVGQVLSSNGSSAPSWLNQSSLSVGSSTNIVGGSLGAIVVQTGVSSTNFLNVGTAGQVITSNGVSPQYVNQSTLSVGSATTATTATNVAGGANGSILVQSGVGTTGQLAIGANGYILTSNGTTPGWSATIPSTSVSGLAASATTDTTNASNISSGTLGLARLSLASGQFYVGDGSGNPAATAKSSIPLSGFGNAAADINIGGFKITNSGTIGSGDADSTVATKGYVDSVAQGLDVKASCLVATTADITLASPGAVTIDGIYSATDFTAGTTRILVKDQSAAAENGIYIWQGPAAAMTRSADANTWDELVGAFTFVERGTANADSGWVCTVNAGGTLGTTAVTWVKFSQAGSYTAGNGIVQSGTSFNFAQSTAYTAGQIPFASSTTAIGFSANLFWDNSNNRLGIGTATPGSTLDINAGTNLNLAVGGLTLDNFTNDGVGITFSRTTDDADLMALGVCDTNKLGMFSREGLIFATGGSALYGQASERLRIASDGVCTWSNVGGVAGTAMTLNGTGLGVGGTVVEKITAYGNVLATDAAGTYPRFISTVGAKSWEIGYRSGTTNYELREDGTTRLVVANGGNVGIGTTTPAYKLDVNGALNVAGGVIHRIGTVPFVATSGGYTYYYGNTNGIVWRNAADTTTQMTLDSSGNLGLGVTPKAWAAGYSVFEAGGAFGRGGIAVRGLNSSPYAQTWLTMNAYRETDSTTDTTGWKTSAGSTSAAILIGGNDNNVIKFLQSPWTAGGNAITWTQAMTLDASGRLGIGTTTINERLEVYGYGKFSSGWKIDTQGIAYGDTGNSLVIGADPGNASANSSIQLFVDGSEKLRIKSTGQVNFVGQASDPAGAAGDVVYNSTSNRLKYHNGTAWVNTGTNKYSGALAGSGTSFTVTHNLGTRDVTVAVRKSGSTYDQVFTDVQMTTDNTVTIVFASSVTGSDYTVTVIG